MPVASHARGRPVAWFTQDRSGRKHKLKAAKAVNETQGCAVARCDDHRAGLSSLCRKHADRLKDIGDPVARVPTRNEIVIFEKAIDLYLATLPKRRQGEIAIELDNRARVFQRPPSWAAMPSDMHHRLPQQARAEIIKAWLTKDAKDPRGFFKRALAVEGWAAVYFDGMPRYRRRFIATHAASWATTRGTPGKKLTRRGLRDDPATVISTPNGWRHPKIETVWTEYQRAHISGPVKARLGQEALDAAYQAYGRGFWDSAVSTQDGRDMTLLDYTKLALRAAGLLPTA